MAPDPAAGIGVKAEFDDQEAQERMKRFEATLRRLMRQIAGMGAMLESMYNRTNNSAQRSTKSQMMGLRRLRWQLVTLTYFARYASRAIQAAYRQMAESAETAAQRGGARALARSYEVDLGRIAAVLRSVSDETLSVQQSIQVALAGMLKDQGQFVQRYADLWQAARVAAVTGGGEAKDIFSALVESMATGSAKAADAVTPIFQLEVALTQYAQAAGKTVDQLEPLEAAEVILQTVLERTNELLAEGADEALATASALERVKAAAADAKDVLGVMTHEVLEQSGVLEEYNKLLRTSSRLLVLIGAGMAEAFGGRTWHDWAASLGDPTRNIRDVVRAMEAAAKGEPGERFTKAAKAGLEALGLFEDDVSGAEYTGARTIKGSARNIEPILDHLLKRQKLIEDHNHRMEKIELRYTQRLATIRLGHEHRLNQIDRKEQRNRARATRAYHRRRLNTTRDHFLRMRQDFEKHTLSMLQAQERYTIRRIQNERLYEYERGLLVAYGDVLAIEDLDARHQLEQQADRENFMQRQQHDEDTYQMQRIQRQAQFAEELWQMRQAFDDQLLEIRIRADEQREEAEYQRQENLRLAKQAYDQQVAEEEYSHNRSLTQWNQYWAKLATQTKLGVEAIKQILTEYFGAGGVLTQIITDFAARADLRQQIRNIVEGVVGPSTTGSTSRVYQFDQYPGPSYFNPQYQHGGSDIYSRPTMIKVGEVPEQVSVRPLYGAGSSMGVSWQGGAIPVHGSGNLEGMDLSGIGDMVAQGLMLEMKRQIEATP